MYQKIYSTCILAVCVSGKGTTPGGVMGAFNLRMLVHVHSGIRFTIQSKGHSPVPPCRVLWHMRGSPPLHKSPPQGHRRGRPLTPTADSPAAHVLHL
jgi:hypothetical protein